MTENIKINNPLALKALQDSWRFNPEFIKVLFYLVGESYDTTNKILETFDSNEEFIEEWKEWGFKHAMQNMLSLLKTCEDYWGNLHHDELVDHILCNYVEGMEIPNINID